MQLFVDDKEKTFAANLLKLAARRDGLKEVHKLTIRQTEEAGLVASIVELLYQRRAELINLTTVCFQCSSINVMERLCNLIEENTTVNSVDLRVVSSRRESFSPTLAKASFGKAAGHLRLQCFCFSAKVMELFCDNICTRPVHMFSLDLNFNRYDEGALSVLSGNLSAMRLSEFLFFEEQDSEIVTCDILNALSKYQLLERVKIRTPSIAMSDILLRSVTRVLPQVKDFVLSGMHFIRDDQWIGLGQAVANAPQLEKFGIYPDDPPVLRQANMLLDGCRYHPRLEKISLICYQVGAQQEFDRRIKRLHTHRTKCLTVLLVAATVRRVGKRSTVWGISRDVFRKLVGFLPAD